MLQDDDQRHGLDVHIPVAAAKTVEDRGNISTMCGGLENGGHGTSEGVLWMRVVMVLYVPFFARGPSIEVFDLCVLVAVVDAVMLK